MAFSDISKTKQWIKTQALDWPIMTINVSGSPTSFRHHLINHFWLTQTHSQSNSVCVLHQMCVWELNRICRKVEECLMSAKMSLSPSVQSPLGALWQIVTQRETPAVWPIRATFTVSVRKHINMGQSTYSLLDLKTSQTFKTYALHSHVALKPTVKASPGNLKRTSPNTYFLLFFFLSEKHICLKLPFPVHLQKHVNAARCTPAPSGSSLVPIWRAASYGKTPGKCSYKTLWAWQQERLM